MKLGEGQNKYKIKFRYKDTGRTTIKNVHANSVKEAKELFEKEYADYEVEIIEVEKIF